jgi:hypothetical protein
MEKAPSKQDVERASPGPDDRDHAQASRVGHTLQRSYTAPFAGRLGGNQAFIIDRDDASSAVVLQDVPDASPGMTLAEQFDLGPLRSVRLWKAAVLEGMGTRQWP